MKSINPNQIEPAMWPAGTPTFAAVLQRIEADPDIAPTRRRDMISGLRRVAKALGLAPEEVVADPGWLRTRLARVMPAALGVTEKSWQNAVSDARAALAHAGIVKRRQRHMDDLLAPWRDLWRAVLASGDRTLKAGLGRFVHFLSNLDVLPEAVTQDHADVFLEALKGDEIARRPEKGWRDAVNAWNLAGQRIAGWPQTPLTLPKRKDVITWSDADLPPAFVKDLAQHMARLGRPDPFAEDGPTRALRPSTLKHHTQMLRRFASELLEAGVPPAEIDSVAALCAPDRARQGLRAMVARNGGKTNTVINDTAKLLLSQAKRLGLDEEVRAGLADLARRLAMPPQRGMTRKNRERLRVLRAEAPLQRLLDLPNQLIRTAHRRTPRAAALAREDALAIAILLFCPVRIGNLASIRIDQHLQRPGDGRVFLVFEDEDVKNTRPLEFELPPELCRMLDRHLATRVPTLCPAGTPWLFPRRDGTGPVDRGTLGTRLKQRIRKEIGIEMNAHLFRHLAVMVWLEANPAGHEFARNLIGHSATSRTLSVYSGLEARAALKAYASLLETKKEGRR